VEKRREWFLVLGSSGLGIGERRLETGDRGLGEFRGEGRKWRMKNEKWKVENGKWRMENEKGQRAFGFGLAASYLLLATVPG
jgi:hypothetical protein